mgnify:FL=1
MSLANRTTDETANVHSVITEVLARYPSIVIAILFGSLAAGRAHRESDLDLAIESDAPLTPELRIQLIDELAVALGRPVDLIDLSRTHNPLLQQILIHGQRVICHDRTRYAELIRRVAYEEADVMPYYRRILAERREAWIGR